MYRLILLLALLALPMEVENVMAQSCPRSGFSGIWKNIRSEIKILASLEVVDTCNQDGPYGPTKVRALEVCHPRHCSWGWTRGKKTNANELTAVFQTFTAKRRVKALRQGSRLRVSIETDYISSDRKDTRAQYILILSRK